MKLQHDHECSPDWKYTYTLDDQIIRHPDPTITAFQICDRASRYETPGMRIVFVERPGEPALQIRPGYEDFRLDGPSPLVVFSTPHASFGG